VWQSSGDLRADTSNVKLLVQLGDSRGQFVQLLLVGIEGLGRSTRAAGLELGNGRLERLPPDHVKSRLMDAEFGASLGDRPFAGQRPQDHFEPSLCLL
jgi:hypothetical protein